MVKKKVLKILFYVRGLLSYVIPKKKNYYLFYPIQDEKRFSGNLKAMILYIAKNHTEIKAVWAGAQNGAKAASDNYPFTIKAGYLKVFWAILRAEYIFLDTHGDFVFRFGKYKIIQLWHGVGYKNVGLLNEHYDEKYKKRMQKVYDKYALFCATSKKDLKRLMLSFNSQKGVITGYPRFDVFFEDEVYFHKIKKSYELENFDKIILYAPTYRDTKTKEPFSKQFFKKLDSYLAENNARFIIKKHPRDYSLQVPDEFENILDFTKKVKDTQELLLIADVLITDYSSISTDFCLSGKPILNYVYDLEDFLKTCRSMFFDLKEVSAKPLIKTEDELLKIIKDNTWFDHPEVKKEYFRFRDTFHQYVDGNSSQRVMTAIKKLN